MKSFRLLQMIAKSLGSSDLKEKSGESTKAIRAGRIHHKPQVFEQHIVSAF
jgi:hypothetical protein